MLKKIALIITAFLLTIGITVGLVIEYPRGNPFGHSFADIVEAPVDVTGTPVAGQAATWSDADTIGGSWILEIYPALSNGQWSGIITTGTAGENLVIGDLVYFKSDGKWWKADADAAATTTGQLAIATGTINADASGDLLTQGYMCLTAWDWSTIGGLLFVGTAGGVMVQTAPSGSGDIVRIVGAGDNDADTAYFNPDWTYIEVP